MNLSRNSSEMGRLRFVELGRSWRTSLVIKRIAWRWRLRLLKGERHVQPFFIEAIHFSRFFM